MKLKYKTVDTRTLKGLKEAERLKRNGWEISLVGFWTIQFCKEIKRREIYAKQEAKK